MMNSLKNSSYLGQKNAISNVYTTILNSILPELENQDLSDLIFHQLISLERHHLLLHTMSSLSLQNDQYSIYSTLCNTWGKSSDGKYPYFFLTGSAGTGKSFMTRQVINFLQSKNKNYLLIALTGVATQNIGGKTIHSSLKIRYWEGRYESLIFSNQAHEDDL